MGGVGSLKGGWVGWVGASWVRLSLGCGGVGGMVWWSGCWSNWVMLRLGSAVTIYLPVGGWGGWVFRQMT